jgi:predicted transcriptional regulator
MPRQSLTITLEADRKAELDRVADAQGRNRDAVIDEAFANWLDLQTWQTREIEAGFADPVAGDFATETDSKASYGRRRAHHVCIRRTRRPIAKYG